MKRLYLVRHGETEANRLKIIQGQNNQQLNYGDYLNSNGEKQAVLLGKALADVKFQFVCTSPARRASDTANTILVHNKHAWRRMPPVENGLLFEVKKELLELDQGTFEGMNDKDAETKYPELYDLYKTRPSQFTFPQGESILKAKERVGRVIERIFWKQPSAENILVVSHGGTIALAFIHIFGLDMDQMYYVIRHNNCAFSIIEWPSPDALPRIGCFNNTSHLK